MNMFVFILISLASYSSMAVDFSKSTLLNWGLQNSVNDSHIHAIDAWKLEEGSKNIVVAVVDTGIDATHPDLLPNMWHDPHTGFYGWDFLNNIPNPADVHGHGTHVAGIIGAVPNAKSGTSGVTHKVSIMAIRYYSDYNTGAQNLRNSIDALNWAVTHGANIINYSGGGPEFSPEEYVALKKAQAKGVLVVTAAGNEMQNVDLPENYYYPCAYRLDNIICGTATNMHNDLISSANWGKNGIDVAAPGDNILSTVPGGKYAYMSGTSQATAFVTGLAALVWSKYPKLKPNNIACIIRESVDPVFILKDKVISGGKINAYSALSLKYVRKGSTSCDIGF